MKLYRIAREKYSRDLSGFGGLVGAARWHDRMRVIYTSVQSSTCVLEKLVHLAQDEIHHDLVIVTMEVPDSVSREELALEALPENWATYPAPPILQRIGNAWLKGQSAALLFHPSVLDPLSMNVLINPAHPHAEQLEIVTSHPFYYDPRLLPKL